MKMVVPRGTHAPRPRALAAERGIMAEHAPVWASGAVCCGRPAMSQHTPKARRARGPGARARGSYASQRSRRPAPSARAIRRAASRLARAADVEVEPARRARRTPPPSPPPPPPRVWPPPRAAASERERHGGAQERRARDAVDGARSSAVEGVRGTGDARPNQIGAGSSKSLEGQTGRVAGAACPRSAASTACSAPRHGLHSRSRCGRRPPRRHAPRAPRTGHVLPEWRHRVEKSDEPKLVRRTRRQRDLAEQPAQRRLAREASG